MEEADYSVVIAPSPTSSWPLNSKTFSPFPSQPGIQSVLILLSFFCATALVCPSPLTPLTFTPFQSRTPSQYFLNLPAKNYLCSLLNTQISSAVPLEVKWVGLKSFFFFLSVGNSLHLISLRKIANVNNKD